MATRKPIPIARILDRVGISEHSGVSQQLHRLAEIEQQILRLLPSELAGHCHVAGLSEGRLRLVADSPAWASRLRFQGARLVQQLNRAGAVTVRTVQVRIIPPVATVATPTRSVRLTPANARLLEQTAKSIGDPGLARALSRLARRGAARSE